MADIDEERLKERIGENPVRYLDRPISSIPDNSSLFLGRVKGIDKLAVIQSWIAVERNLDREGCPRDHVVEILERRKNHILDVGERPDLLTTPNDERPERFQRRQEDRDLPPVEYTWLNADGEAYERGGVPKNDRLSRYLKERKAEAEAEDQEITVASAGAGEVAVAPDGGRELDGEADDPVTQRVARGDQYGDPVGEDERPVPDDVAEENGGDDA